MPLETGTKISDLNAAWPLGSDPKSQGDDHLRLIKAVLQNDALTKETDLADLLSKTEAADLYLALAGGILTGALTLAGDPTEDLQAATKQYVDNSAARPAALCNFFTSSGTVNIRSQSNISQIIRSNTGRFEIVFETPLANANYIVVGNYCATTGGPPVGGGANDGQFIPNNYATDRFYATTAVGSGSSDYRDPDGLCNFVVFSVP